MDLIRIGIKKVISVNEVLAIEACDNYSFIHTKTEKFITSKTLAYYERQDIGFWRTHKHALINPRYIDQTNDNEIILRSGGSLSYLKMPISKRKKKQLRRATTIRAGYLHLSYLPVTPELNASFWQQAA